MTPDIMSNQPYYSIIRDSESMLFCDRCGAYLAVGVCFDWHGEALTVGRTCARHYGITWTKAVGPCADDPDVYQRAVALHRQRGEDRPAYRWPDGWQALRDALGSIAWKRAQNEAAR